MTADRRETNASMTELLTRYTTLTARVSMTREEVEDEMHTAVWREDWEDVLRLVALLPDGPSYERACECLTLAIQKAPFEVVTTLLDTLSGEEYAECDTYYVNWSPTGEVFGRLRWEVNVRGTMLMHAVASNRPEIVQLLLERGYDVNCASQKSAAAILKAVGDGATIVCYGENFLPYHAYTARPEHRVRLQSWDTGPDDIVPLDWEGATPLALALLLGHEECARILVEHGAWLEEAPSVSSAMYLFWREDDAGYRAARAAVLQKGSHDRHRPRIEAAGTLCSPHQLRGILEEFSYSQEELSHAAYRMLLDFRYPHHLWKHYEQGWQDLCQRLWEIGTACPEALCDPKVVGALLSQADNLQKANLKSFFPFFEGRTLELSCMGRMFWRLQESKVQQFLEMLAQRCTLVMDRDAVPSTLPNQAIRLLLRHITWLPPAADRGISGLSGAIFHSGDLRLVRQALRDGTIPPEESREELLHYQQAAHCSPECRLALLTGKRPAPTGCSERPVGTGETEYRWFPRMKQEAMPLLTAEDWEPQFYPTLAHPFGRWDTKAAGRTWEVREAFLALCMAGRMDILPQWLAKSHRLELQNTGGVFCEEKKLCLVLTPLCAAALAGQREVVELLLAHGAPVREEIYGNPCVWNERGVREGDEEIFIPFHSVLAAALGGHWDIVELLLSHGARWDWQDTGTQYIWRQFHEEALEDAVKRHLGG